jgi:hypothetical protein
MMVQPSGSSRPLALHGLRISDAEARAQHLETDEDEAEEEADLRAEQDEKRVRTLRRQARTQSMVGADSSSRSMLDGSVDDQLTGDLPLRDGSVSAQLDLEDESALRGSEPLLQSHLECIRAVWASNRAQDENPERSGPRTRMSPCLDPLVEQLATDLLEASSLPERLAAESLEERAPLMAQVAAFLQRVLRIELLYARRTGAIHQQHTDAGLTDAQMDHDEIHGFSFGQRLRFLSAKVLVQAVLAASRDAPAPDLALDPLADYVASAHDQLVAWGLGRKSWPARLSATCCRRRTRTVCASSPPFARASSPV